MHFIFILFSPPLLQSVTFRTARSPTKVKHELWGGGDCRESVTLGCSLWTASPPLHTRPCPPGLQEVTSPPSLPSARSGCSRLRHPAVGPSGRTCSLPFPPGGTEHPGHSARGQHSARPSGQGAPDLPFLVGPHLGTQPAGVLGCWGAGFISPRARRSRACHRFRLPLFPRPGGAE